MTLSNFAKKKYVEGGLTPERIFVRPNFLTDDPGIGKERQSYALFVGRLSHEKGIHVLLDAWRNFPNVPLKIAGDGPLKSWIEEYISRNNLNNVEVLGKISQDEVFKTIKKFLVPYYAFNLV